MTTIAIDTLKTVQKLKQQGFSAEQAEGIVETITESELVTKSDLSEAIAEAKVSLIMWMVSLQVASTSLLLATKFFG